MNIALKILTLLFAAFWLVFGLNGLFHFFPIPAPAAESAYFMAALEKSGYVMPLTYGAEIIGGLMLLTSKTRFSGLLLLSPVTLNILLYDIFLNPSGLAIGGIIAVIHALILWQYRNRLCRLICNEV